MNPNQNPTPGQVPSAPTTPVVSNTPAPNPALSAPNPAQVAPNQLPNNGFPPAHNPYDFITNPKIAPKKKFAFNGNSLRARVLTVLGIGMVLILLIVAVSNLLSSKSNANATALRNLQAEQQEIIRVATLGIKDSTSPTTANFAQTTLSSVTTEQMQLTEYLTSKKLKTSRLQLNSKLDKKTDSALDAAKQTNTYDDIFTSTLLGLLTTYANDTASAYKNASNSTSKALLETSFNSTSALVKGFGKAATTPTP